MSAFLVAMGLAVLFVVGAVFALQPSPRQRQLAALRQAAAQAGLRVRLQHGESEADYVLAWRGADLDAARETDFVAGRDEHGGWSLRVRGGPREQALREALALLPGTVVRVAGGADGLVARWPERGGSADVQAIALALARLREACAGRG